MIYFSSVKTIELTKCTGYHNVISHQCHQWSLYRSSVPLPCWNVIHLLSLHWWPPVYRRCNNPGLVFRGAPCFESSFIIFFEVSVLWKIPRHIICSQSRHQARLVQDFHQLIEQSLIAFWGQMNSVITATLRFPFPYESIRVFARVI